MIKERVVGFFSAIVKPFADVRPEERRKIFLMFFYFLLTISTIYILKPVRSALFLSEFSAEKLRFVNIGEGIFLIFVVLIYAFFAKRLSHKVLYPATLVFLITNLAAFWYFSKKDIPAISAVFYIWQSSFSAMITTQFWILANDIFKPEEAKRLFGLMISGGSAGGVFGGFLASWSMTYLRTEDLLHQDLLLEPVAGRRPRRGGGRLRPADAVERESAEQPFAEA